MAADRQVLAAAGVVVERALADADVFDSAGDRKERPCGYRDVVRAAGDVVHHVVTQPGEATAGEAPVEEVRAGGYIPVRVEVDAAGVGEAWGGASGEADRDCESGGGPSDPQAARKGAS